MPTSSSEPRFQDSIFRAPPIGFGHKWCSSVGQWLIDFKSSLTDPTNALQSWRVFGSSPCDWAGVICRSDSLKVVSLNLHNLSLSGTLSSSVCKVEGLLVLNLSMNSISGAVPDELGYCQHLEVLDLSSNRFHGRIPSGLCGVATLRKLDLSENYMFDEIPDRIGDLKMLEELVIYSNNLTGSIPRTVGRLKKLRIIRAGLNFISGAIPMEISECDNLEILGLAQNRLEGSLPPQLERIKNLTSIILWQNRLSGSIPPELGSCSNLQLLALNDNAFTGSIPKEIGNLSKLKKLYIYTNQLNGTIPRELGNLVNAVEIDLSENRLTGVIPKELGLVPNLRLLHLFENMLQGRIPRELGQLRQLRNLDLSINKLTGEIPLEFQNLTLLEDLQLFDNRLGGTIPPLIGAFGNLSVLDISSNGLSGAYVGEQQAHREPLSEFSSLANLTALELHENKFSGLIPPEVGQMKNLERLRLSNNYFIGKIPPEIGKLEKLVTFNISSNHLSGSIPHELGNCTQLQRLDLSRNQFAGYVPEELGNLVNLELLSLSDNKLEGAIPGTLGSLLHLTELQMGGNYLSGQIPAELGQLRALQIALNISHNTISGNIPEDLGNLQMLESLYLNNNKLVGAIPSSIGGLLSLLVCNLSFNNLVGMVPNNQVFGRMDASNFIGNKGLCVSGLPPCHALVTAPVAPHTSWIHEGSSKEKIVSIIASVIGLISLILTVVVCWIMKHRRPVFVAFDDHIKKDVSDNYYFPKEGFTYQALLEATGYFTDSSIIGSGACGTVYKALMPDGRLIAVKKLKPCGEASNIDNSFRAEISTLGKIRHCNIVKLYGFCYHQDSNLLLYEYMANGSLGEILHGNGQSRLLDWNTRYKIAFGAAEGLCYLHCDCKPQIIHRDIKSNNILLDETLEAHVGDFGLAKLIDLPYSKSMSAVAGSYGYIAPEYAYTMKVTEKCDIYSFGVVMLELVTGRSPVQPIDQGGDLVNWVRRTMQSATSASVVFDQRLDLSAKRTVEEMSLVLKIAMFCTNTSPLNRPTMREVIAMLIDAKEISCSPPSSPTSETPLDEDAACRGWCVCKRVELVCSGSASGASVQQRRSRFAGGGGVGVQRWQQHSGCATAVLEQCAKEAKQCSSDSSDGAQYISHGDPHVLHKHLLVSQSLYTFHFSLKVTKDAASTVARQVHMARLLQFWSGSARVDYWGSPVLPFNQGIDLVTCSPSSPTSETPLDEEAAACRGHGILDTDGGSSRDFKDSIAVEHPVGTVAPFGMFSRAALKSYWLLLVGLDILVFDRVEIRSRARVRRRHLAIYSEDIGAALLYILL
ncbi:hypothetical protein Syun_028291 [Stephania yunnanensis]|uniref:Protein kinase domain-containing protein n=1 Tax=Stephania yunnanensis TaxID=152371 RepID=A0AAP0EJL7_9MAGN